MRVYVDGRKSKLLEKAMWMVLYIDLIASTLCSLVLWSAQRQCYLYRLVPEEYESFYLFVIFFIVEATLQMIALALIFWDITFLLVNILVLTNYGRKLM